MARYKLRSIFVNGGSSYIYLHNYGHVRSTALTNDVPGRVPVHHRIIRGIGGATRVLCFRTRKEAVILGYIDVLIRLDGAGNAYLATGTPTHDYFEAARRVLVELIFSFCLGFISREGLACSRG